MSMVETMCARSCTDMEFLNVYSTSVILRATAVLLCQKQHHFFWILYMDVDIKKQTTKYRLTQTHIIRFVK